MQPSEKLVYMANQIARNFAIHGQAEAIEATADHIAKFWDPRMRSLIVEHASAGGAGLDPVAREAIAQLRHAL